jgi:hypothetical protein
MLQTRHRPDKENQVHRLPKTPGQVKSIIHKTPFHDESQNVLRTGKKSVNFDGYKFNAFQTPGKTSPWLRVLMVAPRRVLGGKDLNTRQTSFHAPPSHCAKYFSTAHGKAWSPPFTRSTHRRHSRKSSLGLRTSPVKNIDIQDDVDVDVEDIEYMPPTPEGFPLPE